MNEAFVVENECVLHYIYALINIQKIKIDIT